MSLNRRIRALEREHRSSNLTLVGFFDAADNAELLGKATVPGFYARNVEEGDTIELLVIDRVAGRLEIVAVI